ncbi:MAG TPA: tail fiber protein [Pyrinomonadaceae bacterium]|nr:tail fiber protein [Pyrinomonadaceae bacterium]
MAEPFLSEIRIFSFNFAPKGWALCNGQLLPINQNQALFSLLGTTYGGDGEVNFALPDLRGRVPNHVGNGHSLGERAGEQAHTLSISEIPTHFHTFTANTAVVGANANADQVSPTGNYWANSGKAVYSTPDPNNQVVLGAMKGEAVSNVGGSQAHLNMQPFLTLNFCIALQGIFPSPN